MNFPDCSNGKATSADHKSQMAYSLGRRCPASHPIAVPAISLILRYPAIASANVFLSSGGVYSGHADFMDAWKPRRAARGSSRAASTITWAAAQPRPGALTFLRPAVKLV